MTTQDEAFPARQRVVGPQIAPTAEEALLDPRRGHLRDSAGTAAQDAGVQELISAKLRLAATIASGFFGLAVLIYVAMVAVPGEGPLHWALPGLVLYPVILAAGGFYLRRILRYDRAYHRRVRGGSKL
ncbi:hypothetical protein [Nesterenkonia flava]|uniref:Integral membrane protein n=1 Tax=Nesterenkonia flava TaxID=469799 RepID=A0ABU1FR41_9MICC|nr:hypothetical protein [Nesterenkonia flava]MDR5711114.1 hypothetical protein [Nesterenkonia flava]